MHLYDRHQFNGLFSMTTWVSRHQNGKTVLENGETVLDFNEVRYDGVTVASAGRYADHVHLHHFCSRCPDRTLYWHTHTRSM